METDIQLFQHDYEVRVRFFHVDRQHVVHNIWYYYYLEEARVEYFRELGMPIDDQTFISHDRFYAVRNSCEYHSAGRFDELLIVKTRTVYIKNSSTEIEHIIVSAQDGRVILTSRHVLVYIDQDSDRPARIPQSMRDKVSNYEKGNLKLIGDESTHG
jgi:acyl-CoA thioester hydrolase